MSAIQMLPRVLPNLGEKAIGLTKEFMGTVFDNESLRRQGQAQQEKATERQSRLVVVGRAGQGIVEFDD